jgi:hypothetical protein
LFSVVEAVGFTIFTYRDEEFITPEFAYRTCGKSHCSVLFDALAHYNKGKMLDVKMLYYSKFTLIIPWSQVQILLGALSPDFRYAEAGFSFYKKAPSQEQLS